MYEYENARALSYISERMAEEVSVETLDYLLDKHLISIVPAHTCEHEFTGWDFPICEVSLDSRMGVGNDFVEFLTLAMLNGAVPFAGDNLISISRRLVPGSCAQTGECAARVIAAAITELPSFEAALAKCVSRWVSGDDDPFPVNVVFVK